MDSDKQTLVIGDVHGQFARLENLLFQEGLLDHCPVCVGEGEDFSNESPTFCGACHGFGVVRVNRDVEVVQLGDLVDLMPMRTSESADNMTMHVSMYWIDTFLWGNHEAPMRGMSTFGGFGPNWAVQQMHSNMITGGSVKLAHAAHGYLITHAGLGDHMFDHTRTGSLRRYDVDRLAAWINRKDQERYRDPWPLRDAIGVARGGWEPYSGIVWRDSREGLWDVPQIFGHTSHEAPMVIPEKEISYCIDTSKHGSLSAIWLPSCEFVTVEDSFSEDG